MHAPKNQLVKMACSHMSMPNLTSHEPPSTLPGHSPSTRTETGDMLTWLSASGLHHITPQGFGLQAPYALATSTIISGWVPSYDSAHSWRFNSAAPLGGHNVRREYCMCNEYWTRNKYWRRFEHAIKLPLAC